MSRTRSRCVSSSSWIGSAVTVISARGRSWDRLGDPLLIAATFSSGSVRETRPGPRRTPARRPGRTRTRSTETTPGTASARLRTCVRQALRRRVEERVDGALREAEPRDRDEQRDADRHERIGLRIAEGRGAEGGEHQDRVDEVGREMQRVGLERLAAGLPRDPPQRPPAPGIDDDRGDEHADGGPARLDVASRRPTRRRTPSNATAPESRNRKRRLDQRRERLRPCRGRIGAPRRPACGRRGPRARSGSWRRRRGGCARRPRSARASRSRGRPRPWRA